MCQPYKPLVSIVIPAYNASNYIKEAIDSALAQTYKNIEVIVVNDGSTDNGATKIVLEQYEGRVVYIEKPNGGSSSALNEGIKNMRGEWFSWLSHDDLYLPDKIEEQISFLNTIKSKSTDMDKHVLFSASELIDKNGKTIRHVNLKNAQSLYSAIENIIDNAWLVAEQMNKYNFNGCSCLIHKNVFQSIGLFDEKLRLVNDSDMWYRIFVNNYKIHYVPKALVKGRIHPGQISSSIAFSFHNEEQDWFWNRTLDWLKNNKSNQKDLFMAFGKAAFQKTRNNEGNEAFNFVLSNFTNGNFDLLPLKFKYIIEAFFKNMLKKVYLKLKIG